MYLVEFKTPNNLVTDTEKQIVITEALNFGTLPVTTLEDLQDIGSLAPLDDYVLKYDGVALEWIAAPAASASDPSKADKVDPVTAGNLASLDADGNLTDSGFAAADFATDSQGALADTAAQPNDNISIFVNDAGYLTAITSADVTTALGYTPQDQATAFSGQYADLLGLPTIPAATSDLTNDSGYITGIDSADVSAALGYTPQNQATAFSGDYLDLANKPTIPTTTSELTNDAGFLVISDTSGFANKVSPVTTGNLAGLNVNGDLTDSGFAPSDFATGAQGTLADTATQPGDNISTLTNDAGFVTEGLSAGANISVLTNDAGYITGIDSSDVTTALGYTPQDSATAFSGDYQDLTNKPFIRTALDELSDVNLTGVADGDVLIYNLATLDFEPGQIDGFSGDYNDLINKPTIPTATSDLTNDSNFVSSGANISVFINDAGYITSAPVDSVAGKTGIVTLNKADITDFVETDYATGAEGDLAASSVQPGDNVSTLTNDAGYVVQADIDSSVTTHVGQADPHTQYVLESTLGQANGVATLDGSGLVPAGQLPSFVDDVIEAADFASLPGTGETGKIYVTVDNNKTYRWSGSAYVEIQASPGTTDDITEGSTNLYFTNQRASDAAPVQTVAGRTGDVTLNKADITDFVETDYATGAEGDLAASATQPGDNVSTLTNDAGYITSTDTIDGGTF